MLPANSALGCGVAGRQLGAARPFVEWLEEVATARALSWRRLAEEAGVSPSALSALRNGQVQQPSMETCYRVAGYLNYDLRHVLRLAGYSVPEQADVDISDPELDLMFHELLDLTSEERDCVKEFVRFLHARAAVKRRPRRRRR